jgi:hypothetical protein
MKTRLLTVVFALAIALFSIGLGSCSKEEKAALCAATWGQDLADELTALSSAGTAYALDPSDGNCQAYKNALQAYLNGLRPYGNCAALTAQDKAELNDLIAEAESDIDDLCD